VPLILRDAVRHLARLRPSSVAATLVLALGMATGAAAFALLDTALLQRLPFPHSERLVQVWATDPRMDVREAGLAVGEYRFIASRTRGFDEVAFYSFWTPTAAAHGQRVQVKVARISSNLFDLLGIGPSIGTAPSDDSQPFIVLSHALTERLYGAADRVPDGVVVLDGRAYTPIGVMPRGFAFPADAQAWVSTTTRQSTKSLSRDGYILGRLAPGVPFERAQVELADVAKGLATMAPDWPPGGALRAVALQEQVGAPVRKIVLLLFTAVTVFFLIACASAGQLLFVANLGRRREWAIRTTLGATRRALVAQLFIESALLAAVATAGGALLAAWLVESAKGLIPPGVPRLPAVAINERVLWFMSALGALAALSVAAVSAFRVARGDPANDLKHAHRTAPRGALLCLGTMALVVLTVSAVSLAFGLWRMTRVDLGFKPAGVLTSRLCAPPPDSASDAPAFPVMFDELRHSLREIPGVHAIAISDQSPVGGYAAYEIFVEGVNGYPEVRVQGVSGSYFSALGIPILEGRAFESAEENAPNRGQVAIVNEAFRDRFWRGRSAVGQRLQGSWADERDWITVVGMSGNVRRSASDTPESPLVFVPFLQRAAGCGYLLVNADQSVTPSLVRAHLWTTADRYSISDVTRLEALLHHDLWQPRLRALVIGGFAAMALVFGSVALYTTLAQLVSARRKELAIRAALGARRGALARIVLSTHALPVAAGLSLGTAAAFVIANSVRASMYGFERLDSTAIAAVFTILAATAVAATMVPALRAEEVDVLAALRNP
jgi:putative ABC transport system permease protein